MSGMAVALALYLWPVSAGAQSLESLIERIDRLEQQNGELRREIDALKAERRSGQGIEERSGGTAFKGGAAGYVRTDAGSGYAILDPTADINRKQRLTLELKRDGILASDSLYLQRLSPHSPRMRAPVPQEASLVHRPSAF